jgi:hypothetical protein
MGKPEEVVLKLNELLEADQFDFDEFKLSITQLIDFNKTKIKVLDFEYFNEDRLSLLQKEKIERIKTQDFDTAAKFRDSEEECRGYISLKTDYEIEKSEFYHDSGYLFYFYFGTAKNDKILKEFLKELG